MLNRTYQYITLENGKKELTIFFEDKQYELLSTFFFVEMDSFEEWIKEELLIVLRRQEETREIAGNVCGLCITRDKTAVYDMLAKDGKGNWCEVDTGELYQIILEWHEKRLQLDAC